MPIRAGGTGIQPTIVVGPVGTVGAVVHSNYSFALFLRHLSHIVTEGAFGDGEDGTAVSGAYDGLYKDGHLPFEGSCITCCC